MATHRIKVGVLTSSRADFGIYLPLLLRLKQDNAFQLELIVFGSHLSRFHGYTLNEIEAQGFKADYKLDTQLVGDSPEAIATSMSLCMMKFAQFWGQYSMHFDIVLCLGDRYEMFAAVSAGAPFGIRFAHLHGGETTLGAIDNFFRHAISHVAWCHFTSTVYYAERLRNMLDVKEHIFFVGSLSLDSLQRLVLLTPEQIMLNWGIDVSRPTILITFHPETVSAENNVAHAYELVKVFENLPNFQLVISMPNADTGGATVRSIFLERLTAMSNVFMVEHFGTVGYFSLMKHCSFLLGNSSSGIIESASFGKYAINIGSRQDGRLQSANIVNVPISFKEIKAAVENLVNRGSYKGENIYYQKNTSDKIIKHIIDLTK